MTTPKKPRAPRNSRPLSPGEAVDLIVERRNSAGTRRQNLVMEFDNDEAEWENGIVGRVPDERRGAVALMLSAVTGEPMPSMMAMASLEEPEAPDLPRGATPYEPGPIARAARNR